MKNIIIAEGHDLLRETYSKLLEELDINTVGVAKSKEELLDLLKVYDGQTILFDLELISDSLTSSLRKISSDNPGSRFIMTGLYNNEFFAEEIIANGAKGYFDKSITDLDTLCSLIKNIENGRSMAVLQVDRKIKTTFFN